MWSSSSHQNPGTDSAVAGSLEGVRSIREKHQSVKKLIESDGSHVPTAPPTSSEGDTPTTGMAGETGLHDSHSAPSVVGRTMTPGAEGVVSTTNAVSTQSEGVAMPACSFGSSTTSQSVPVSSVAYSDNEGVQLQMLALSVGEGNSPGQTEVQNITAVPQLQPSTQTLAAAAHTNAVPVPGHYSAVPASGLLPYASALTDPSYPHVYSGGGTGSSTSTTDSLSSSSPTTDQLRETIRRLQQELLEKEVEQKLRQQQQLQQQRAASQSGSVGVSIPLPGGISPQHTGLVYGAGDRQPQQRHSGPQQRYSGPQQQLVHSVNGAVQVSRAELTSACMYNV